jgi:hypothetical protein
LDVGGRIILRWILREMGWGSMDLIDLAGDRDLLRVLEKTVINLPVPQNVGKFLSS